MNNWVKSPVTIQQIAPLCEKFNIDKLLASILVRRGITEGKDILYFLESDMRFTHNPFLFNSMEDAVERITQAEEEGEKILIFGDRDVDGVTSTTILYDYLKQRNIDVRCRLPLESEAYGLSKQAVDDFAAEDGTLIITVDCGISNFEEIEYAASLGIDVIVTDHHNAPENLPPAIVILDPKAPDSGYPFVDISGAAVAFKLVSALRFSHSDFYNSELCLMDITELEDSYEISCVKIRNLVKVKELHEKIIPGKTTIYDLKLPYFLQGQVIYAWNSTEIKKQLNEIFGSGIEFSIYDLQAEVVKLIPALKGKTSSQIHASSTIAKYMSEQMSVSVIDSLFNLYVTWCKKFIAKQNEGASQNEQRDLQLVALAAIADIMPLKNENRIFIKRGIASIKEKGPREGLSELFAQLKINPQALTSTDIAWTITPALNAAGRLGQADLALSLLISSDPAERNSLAARIYSLNEERKRLVSMATFQIKDNKIQYSDDNDGKLFVIVDENIHPGITGNIAGKLMQDKNIPAIVVTKSEDVYKGSMRSCRGFICTEFLSRFGDFFINYGGHNAAAGFSFNGDKLELFHKKIKEIVPSINLEEENLDIYIDAEIPPEYLTPETFNLLDKMEPFGSENRELTLVSKNVRIIDAIKQGKKEPLSLKLVFEFGKYKIPAMFFGQAERLGKDIFTGQSYEILYTMVKNYFNGNVTPQLRLKEVRKS
ncbi:MAG: single-stranded-DNA-specific exonuclease RecJ [Treponema sp.]|nr:single-stranded-DNA-specific exonuclease RecJ [Treponema sp.]